MRILKLSEVPLSPPLTGPLFHKSGATLVHKGDPLSATVRDRMQRAGIDEVYVPESGDDVRRFRLEAIGRKVLLSEIPDGTPLRREIRDERGRLLTLPNTVLDSEVRALFGKWGVQGFYLKRSPAELGLDQVELFRAIEGEPAAWETSPHADFPVPPLTSARIRGPRDLSESKLRKWIDVQEERRGAPMAQQVARDHRMAARSAEHKAGFLRVYEALLRDVRALQGRLRSMQHEPWTEVETIARSLVAGLARDPELLVNLVNLKARGEYLSSHALHTAILAASIGLSAGAPAEEVFELAVAGLLARVGMLRVPEEIREKPERLTTEETAQTRRAPSLGLAMLRKIDRLPVRVAIASYQVMERLDGSGYPQGLEGEGIHRVSRIVALADCYDALLADRPWRGALMPYRAMEVLLLLVNEKRLDGELARTLLDAVSLFPLGSWVELSDGRVARVVAANGAEHTRPVVSALYARDGAAIPAVRIDLLQQGSPSVVRAIEGDDLTVGTLDGW